MAARVAERLALGHRHVSAASGKDQQLAAEIAKEMVVSHGYGEHIGPVQLPQANADQSGLVDLTLQDEVLQVSQNLAKVVLHDVETLVRAAEAKAYFGLAQNWPLFERLVQQVLDERFVLGSAFYATLRAAGDDFFVFPSQALSGFGFAADGRVQYPDMTNWKDRKKMRRHRLHSYGGAAPGNDEAPRFRWPAELVVDVYDERALRDLRERPTTSAERFQADLDKLADYLAQLYHFVQRGHNFKVEVEA